MKKTKINVWLVIGLLSLAISPVFALELNSGNIASLWCISTDKECNLSDQWITKIHTGAFAAYTGLRTIDLSGNAISEITTGMFSGLADLSFLSLANNQINTIGSWSFQNLKSLSKLDISNNKITDITKAMFSGLKSLTTLYLWGNTLSFVESGFVDYLSGVKMLLVAPKTDKAVSSSGTELDTAFAFAKKYELTYAASLDSFGAEKAITRRALAKILALYMKNYKEADAETIRWCARFSDISGETEEDQWYIQQACEYKLMGRNANGKIVAKKFNPGKEVTRAHFATILSRILWWEEYNSTDTIKYYQGHINALKKAWILTNTDPKITEPRGFIILMLSRTE